MQPNKQSDPKSIKYSFYKTFFRLVVYIFIFPYLLIITINGIPLTSFSLELSSNSSLFSIQCSIIYPNFLLFSTTVAFS